MPRYAKKNTFTTKKKYTPRRKTTTNFATRVKAVINKTSETKNSVFVGTEIASSTLTSPATYHNLNTLYQGTDKQNRIGQSVNGMLMDIRGSIMSPHQTPIFHKIFVLEKNFQSDPLVDMLEDNTGNFAPAGQDLSAIYARINTHKYRVLGTKVLKTGSLSSSANGANAAQLFNMTVKTPGKYDFDDNVNNPQKRQIVLLMISRRADNDETLGSSVELTYNCKWYFKDN